MKSLLKMSDDELAQVEAGSGLRPTQALGIAGLSGCLAMAGMMLRFVPGDEVPVAGMDTFSGQCTIAAALGCGMLVAAYLIRNVFMKHLQWAVLFSLLIHLTLCVALKSVVVDVPLAAATDIGDSLPPRDITMPDYGGAESQSQQQQQEWERPTDVDVQETEQQQLQRQNAEVEIDTQIDPLELQRRVADANLPERQQQEQERLQREQQLEIERQQQEARPDTPQPVEAPQVQTADVQQPKLEAREMDRQTESQLQEARREMQAREARNDPRLSASRLSHRAEVRPENDLRADFEQQQRQAAVAQAAELRAQSVDVASVSEAAQMTPEAESLETRRQARAELEARNRAERPDLTSPEVNVSRQSLARSQNALMENATPSSGGAASLQRSAVTSGQNPSAANAAAESVAVSAAGGSREAQLNASTAASEVSREQSAVPGGSNRGGSAPAMTPNPFGASALRSGTIGRSQGSQSGPEMGDAVAANNSGSGGTRSSTRGDAVPGAVGTSAEQVQVGGVAAGTDAAARMVAAGPSSAASDVSRNGRGLPAARAERGAAGGTPNGTTGSMTIARNSTGRDGLASGRTTPSARLQGTLGFVETGSNQEGSSTGRGRSSAGPSLPENMLRAEEAGALVLAGPQAPMLSGGSSPGTFDGPRSTSLPRQSAGLPGVTRSSAGIARARTGLPGGVGAASLPGRPRTGTGRPKLATDREVASLIRRSIPGISTVPSERISAGFSMRTPEARKEAVQQLGGNDASEAAVDRGLEWLAAHQYAAGNWSIHSLNCVDHECQGGGSYQADPAATGLALLAFLGAGHTHQTGDYQQEVQRGLNWLLENQASDGDLFNAESEFARFYSHGMAAIALCEAFGMTKDRRLEQAAQRSLDFIVASQHEKFGGWRYKAQFESDTSVSGWQTMALKSGEMAGLKVPRPAYAGIATWLDAVEDTNAPGRFRYHPTKEVTDSMTAEGLLMRQYLGAGRQDSALQAGASHLQARLPREDGRDVYYWYYATQVMFHMQGEHWESWNAALRDMLVETQDKGGPTRGSWDPERPTKDMWGRSGGRHYVTCLNLLMLEVYYRHLPLYIELDQ